MTLRLSDTAEVTGELAYKREEDNNIMLVFRINKSVEELIAYRKISLDIVWWSYSGLKVPNSAIIEEDDLTYVIRNRTGYKDKILVKVNKKNQNYSIISNYTSEELRELGWTQETIANRKVISLYDEVTINKNRRK